MVFQFNVDYKTVYGEELVLHITIDGKEVQHKMCTSDGQRWVYELDVTPKSKTCTYYYSVIRDGFCCKSEWQVVKHQLNCTAERASV